MQYYEQYESSESSRSRLRSEESSSYQRRSRRTYSSFRNKGTPRTGSKNYRAQSQSPPRAYHNGYASPPAYGEAARERTYSYTKYFDKANRFADKGFGGDFEGTRTMFGEGLSAGSSAYEKRRGRSKSRSRTKTTADGEMIDEIITGDDEAFEGSPQPEDINLVKPAFALRGLNNKLAAHMDRMKILEEENSFLRKQIDVLTHSDSALGEARRQMEKLIAEKKKLEDQFAAQKNDIEKNKENVAIHIDKLRAVQQQNRELAAKTKNFAKAIELEREESGRKIAKLEDEIENLKRMKYEWSIEEDRLSKESKDTATKITQLEEEINRLKSELGERNEQIDRLSADNKNLKAEQENSREEREKIRSQQEHLKDEEQRLKTEMEESELEKAKEEEAQNKIKTMEEEYMKLKMAIDQVEKTVAPRLRHAKEQCDKLMQEKAELELELSDVQKKNSENMQRAEKEARLRRELEDELARVKEHLERANRDREELEGKVKGLRNELQDKLQVKMAMEEYQAKNKDLQAELDRLKKDFEEAKRRQTELRQKLQVTTTQLEGQGETSKELNDEKIKVQNLMAEIERMKRDLKTADALREEQEGKIRDLLEELEAAKDKHKEYEREIDRLKELEDELHTVKMTLEETLTIRRELEVSLEATQQEIHITKMEITQKEEAANTSMAADKDRLQSDLDNLRQEGDEMRDELDKLRRELENANRLREEAEQKLADGAQELDDMKGQLETFEGNNERADQLESEIDRMKRELHLNLTLKVELEQKSSELELRIQSLIEELDESRRKEKEAMKKYQLESNRCLELEEEVVRVKKEVRIELESRIIQLKEELENKLRCEREHQEQLDISRRDIDLELNKLKMQLAAAQKENDQMNATIQQQVTQIQAAETTQASSGQQQQDLMDELECLRQQLKDANASVLNLTGQLDSAKDEVDGRNNDLLLKLQQMEQKGDDDDKERKDLQNEIDRLKRELEDGKNKNMELSYQLGAAKDDLERKTQEMTTMITTMKETVIVQPQDNSDLLSALGDLKKQYADLANKKDDDKDDWYKDKFDDLTKQLQKANDALLAAKEEILNLNKQLGDSDDEVEALRKLLKELEGQLADKEKEAETGADQAEKDLEEMETKLMQAEEDAADQIMELALKNMELLNEKMDADRDNWIYKDLLADENGKLILEPISPWTFMQTVIPEMQIEEITIISEEAVEMREIREVKKGEEIIKVKEGEKVMVKVIEEGGEKVKITQIIDAAGAIVLEIREELHMKTTEPGYLGYKMIEVEERSDVFKSTLEKFIFYLINRQDGQALGVVSGEGVTESEIAIRSKADGKEQLWSFTNGMIINRLNNLALDVPGANAKDDAKVVATQPVPGKKSQQWVLHGDGFIRTALNDSLVLDNTDGTLTLKTKIPNAAEAKVQEWDLVILGDTAEFNRELKISEEMIMEMSISS